MNDMEQAGKEISEAYLQLDQSLEIARNTLLKLGCPSEVSIDVVSTDPTFKHILWVKHKGRFCICVADENQEYRPLEECNVNVKLEILANFEHLLKAVIDVTKEVAKRIREKTEKFIIENNL